MRVVIAPVDATFATHGGTAVVELATAAGIGLLAVPAPLTATTRGVGELIRAALDTGARRIVLGISGSATADGNAGCCRPPRADGGDRTCVGAWPRRNVSSPISPPASSPITSAVSALNAVGRRRTLVRRPGQEHPDLMTEPAGRPLVLVDVRPTECGHRALLWALREAERRDAQLLAITVWPGDPAQLDEGRAEMEAALAAMVERAVEETGVHGRTRVAALTHPVTVADVAVRTGAELLVMGTEQVAAG